jgi:coenzyme F420-0:L-glutamate ligase/coenzyme F420-1:gamma-L-glutamate ligase
VSATKSAFVAIQPVVSPVRKRRFLLGPAIKEALSQNSIDLGEGDVIVVSSKFVAMSEGRYVNLRAVKPGKRAVELSRRFGIDARLAELVLEESTGILGGVSGFLLAIARDGTLAPNAGIDRSNIQRGYAILYPRDPKKRAHEIREYLSKFFAKPGRSLNRFGVVISDSRVTPTRIGTVGVAVATSGLKPVIDLRGSTDLFGNKLRFTLRAIADQLATAAQLVMGESKESIPIVRISGAQRAFFGTDQRKNIPMTISPKKCLFVEGLRKGRDVEF